MMKTEQVRRDTVLVVPSIREDCLKKFIDKWDGVNLFGSVDLLVVEDNPKKTFDLSKQVGGEWFGHQDLDESRSTFHHYSWEDIDADLKDLSWIIPRRSDCVRSYGYLTAYRLGYENVMTMDDDCYPEEGFQDLAHHHRRCLDGRTRWYSTLDSARPRGLPYLNQGTRGDIVLNHGLWTNVLDYDACNQLANPVKEEHDGSNRIVPNGSYFPMCGMNLMWKRKATVLMYHLLMGSTVEKHLNGNNVTYPEGPVTTRLPFDRFGDIWCGILMKKVCDHLRWSVSTGSPYVHHDRASNPFANLRKEANGIEVNERFWEHVDKTPFHPMTIDPVDCYYELGKHVAQFDAYPEHKPYFRRLGEAMQVWSSLF